MQRIQRNNNSRHAKSRPGQPQQQQLDVAGQNNWNTTTAPNSISTDSKPFRPADTRSQKKKTVNPPTTDSYKCLDLIDKPQFKIPSTDMVQQSFTHADVKFSLNFEVLESSFQKLKQTHPITSFSGTTDLYALRGINYLTEHQYIDLIAFSDLERYHVFLPTPVHQAIQVFGSVRKIPPERSFVLSHAQHLIKLFLDSASNYMSKLLRQGDQGLSAALGLTSQPEDLLRDDHRPIGSLRYYVHDPHAQSAAYIKDQLRAQYNQLYAGQVFNALPHTVVLSFEDLQRHGQNHALRNVRPYRSYSDFATDANAALLRQGLRNRLSIQRSTKELNTMVRTISRLSAINRAYFEYCRGRDLSKDLMSHFKVFVPTTYGHMFQLTHSGASHEHISTKEATVLAATFNCTNDIQPFPPAVITLSNVTDLADLHVFAHHDKR